MLIAQSKLCDFACVLGMIAWEHIFAALESVPTPTACWHETMDRNHLGRCTALSSGTECERYWEARTKRWKTDFFPSISVTAPYY